MISEYVNLYGEWCESEVELFARILKPEANVVEVGANIGMHAVPLAKICSKGKIFCYEPQRIISSILNANIALNNLVNVHVSRLAIGSSDGYLEIESTDYDTPWNYGSFSIANGFSSEAKFSGAQDKEVVAIKALDDVEDTKALTRLDLLKIDVEGLERTVLEGASRLVSKFKPMLFIENNNAEHGDALIDFVAGLGYASYWFASSRFRANNFNKSAGLLGGHDINMICFPGGSKMPEDLNLMPVVNFSQIKTGIPLYS